MRRSVPGEAWFLLSAALLVVGFVGWWGLPWGADPRPVALPVGSGLEQDAMFVVASSTPFGAMLAIWISTGALILCWWRWTSAPGASAHPYLPTLALAVTAPLSMVPLVDFGSIPWLASLVGLVVAGLAVLPLGWLLASQVVRGTHRSRAQGSVLLLAAAGVGLGYVIVTGDLDWTQRALRWIVVSLVVLLPASVVAYELLRGQQRVTTSAQRRAIEALTVLAVGVLPAVSGLCLALRSWPGLVLPVLAAAVTALVLARFAVQPLAHLAASAAAQRDQVVAATETERTRLASVLHDGPLADIALLIQRLDDRGDVESAAIARGVANELRAVGSELRLPILDDLGTGPALEWLVGRLSDRSGVRVDLQQTTVVRPPASVELAAYRVAQEALVNALKHGSAPISVRYTATTAGVSLSVDDAGPGIDRDAPRRAEREGRLGLASMAQRAEAIGAQLVLGGTGSGAHVGLEWRAAGP
jgi:signal transduction histidine kinase